MSIIGQDPSASKSSQVHVVMFRFVFVGVGYIPLDSSRMMCNIPVDLNFNQVVLNSTGSSGSSSTIGENQESSTNGPVEFEK